MVGPLGYEEEKTVLLDAEDHEYDPAPAMIRGIKYTDPTDIRSPYEAVEGADGFFVFEVPINEELSKLVFIYSFKETWEEESAKRGRVDIILL